MSELEPTRTYSNHTATEILRRMLDERGVEWEDGGEGLTIIPAQDGVPRAWEVNTWPSGKDMGDCLWVQNCHPLTPAQVIAATLGATDARPTQVESSGTCTVEGFDDGIDEALDGSPIYTTPTWYLSCGHTCEGAERPSFCKNCGRKVVSE